jgi:hypothetical protein
MVSFPRMTSTEVSTARTQTALGRQNTSWSLVDILGIASDVTCVEEAASLVCFEMFSWEETILERASS